MFDMGDTLLEKIQTQHQPKPQEESDTLCEIEKFSFATEALLDNYVPLKDIFGAVRESKEYIIVGPTILAV
ncbi:hypothetical protein H5410_033130 [Solanum commersonii]|uniref:Uncharacterized protein n=1 Tax=Solanum commersonii TaxID=4109 RepID=A0A9J5YPW1_SOLCO|nr:hypothetical protein H5410_033130 [Solanum commersonii]